MDFRTEEYDTIINGKLYTFLVYYPHNEAGWIARTIPVCGHTGRHEYSAEHAALNLVKLLEK